MEDKWLWSVYKLQILGKYRFFWFTHFCNCRGYKHGFGLDLQLNNSAMFWILSKSISVGLVSKMWSTPPSEADVGNNHFELGKHLCRKVKICQILYGSLRLPLVHTCTRYSIRLKPYCRAEIDGKACFHTFFYVISHWLVNKMKCLRA